MAKKRKVVNSLATNSAYDGKPLPTIDTMGSDSIGSSIGLSQQMDAAEQAQHISNMRANALAIQKKLDPKSFEAQSAANAKALKKRIVKVKK